MSILFGTHPVHEALLAGRPMERVLIARGAKGPRLSEITELCRSSSVPLRFEDRKHLDRIAAGGVHQGVVAIVSEERYTDAERVIAAGGMVVVLDGVEDPRNLGAILRTAEAAGVGGVILPERRSAGLTASAVKASAGAASHLPVVRVTNVGRVLDTLKQRGFWIYGLDERGDHDYDIVEFTSPAALVVGGEGKGLHQHVQKRCDFLVRIPLAGKVSSLNVSVACGIALFEWKRRRGRG